MERKFILCYHDFSARNFREASEHVRLLSEVVGGPLAIAVIPSMENVGNADALAFRNELVRLENSGHELLLHGARHLALRTFSRSVPGKAALFLTGGEAEFAGLGKRDSLALLEQAIGFWNVLSLSSPLGFVPPAWYGNSFLKRQVLEKIAFYEGRFFVMGNSRNRRTVFSPAISFAGLPAWSLSCVMSLAKIVLRLPSGVPRLVFHPVDFENLGKGKILSLAKKFTENRKKILYRDF